MSYRLGCYRCGGEPTVLDFEVEGGEPGEILCLSCCASETCEYFVRREAGVPSVDEYRRAYRDDDDVRGASLLAWKWHEARLRELEREIGT